MFVGCVRKHEQSKKGVIKELFSENRGFSCEERVIYDITGSKDMENVETDRKF